MKAKKLLALVLALIMAFSCMSIIAFATEPPAVSYLSPVYNTDNDPTAGLKKMETLSCTNYSALTAGGTISSGWYVVDGNVSITTNVECSSGDLHIILKDNSHLSITTNSNMSLSSTDNSIYIYAQSEGSSAGKLSVTTSDQQGLYGDQDLYINGGNISVDNTTNLSFAIYVNFGNFVVNGGTLTVNATGTDAKGTLFANDKIIINGGILKLNSASANPDKYNIKTSGNLYINGGDMTIISNGCRPIYVNKNYKISNSILFAGASEETAERITSNTKTTLSNTALKYMRFYPAYSLTFDSSLTGKGGVTFTVNGCASTVALAGDLITATATAVDGYIVKLSSTDVTFTTNTGDIATFTMPEKAVKLTATYIPNATLDLDTTSDNKDVYSDSAKVAQKYSATVNENKTDVTKVQVSWKLQDIDVTITDNKIWNTQTLTWDEDTTKTNGVEATNPTAEFNFVNLSSQVVYAKLTFTEETGFTPPTKAFTENSETEGTGDGIIKLDTRATSETTDNTGKIKLVLTVTDSDFASFTENTTNMKYGTYTVEIFKNEQDAFFNPANENVQTITSDDIPV